MLANACRKKIERDNRGNLLSRLFFNLGCGICLSNHIPSDPLESALLIKKKWFLFFPTSTGERAFLWSSVKMVYQSCNYTLLFKQATSPSRNTERKESLFQKQFVLTFIRLIF